MQVIIFDTETSGRCAKKNVILSLSYQVVETSSWNIIKEQNYYFPWPDEESRVELDAIAVNGLTKDFLSTVTLSDRKEVMETFLSDVSCSDMIVAHNLDFDKRFVIQTCKEYGVECDEDLWQNYYDTMQGMRKDCCACDKKGRIKNPKLEELARYLKIDTSDIDFHKSSADVELTKRCFREITSRGLLKISHIVKKNTPRVHSKKPKIRPEDKVQCLDWESIPDNPIKNKVVVISGFKDKTLSQHYGEIIHKLGGKPKDTFVKECGYLLLGGGYTEKDKTAIERGDVIINELEFQKIIDQYRYIWMN